MVGRGCTHRCEKGAALAVLAFALLANILLIATTRTALVVMLWRSDPTPGSVMAMALMGFGFYVLLDWLERLTCPWAEARR